jgi:metal-responsive CopG/Arc/MetJ family transcriptional regulator
MSRMRAPRVKISVSLPRELVARIDQAARAEARSRSRVLEGWLRASARARAARELEAATVAYYEGLTPADWREEEAMASASSRAARRLRIDDPPASVLRAIGVPVPLDPA